MVVDINLSLAWNPGYVYENSEPLWKSEDMNGGKIKVTIEKMG